MGWFTGYPQREGSSNAGCASKDRNVFLSSSVTLSHKSQIRYETRRETCLREGSMDPWKGRMPLPPASESVIQLPPKSSQAESNIRKPAAGAVSAQSGDSSRKARGIAGSPWKHEGIRLPGKEEETHLQERTRMSMSTCKHGFELLALSHLLPLLHC